MAESWVLGGCIGIAGFVLSIAVAMAVLVRLPADYFSGDGKVTLLPGQPPWVRKLAHVGKNVAGVLLVLLGAVLSIPGVPGQGLLTILIGVVLVDLPGKRALERKMLRLGPVRRGVDGLRRRFGREPFDLDGIAGLDPQPR